MKTVRNEQHGFEIDMPEEWAIAPSGAYEWLGRLSGPTPGEELKDSFQFGCANEAFNFVIGPLFPERLLERTEFEFRLYAQNNRYTDLEFGRITVEGKEHVWARYRIQDQMGDRWNKKYMIVLGTTEYSITATCNSPQWFAQREKVWNSIIASFRLMESRKQDIREQQAQRTRIAGSLYEKAYAAVSAGHYTKAHILLEKCLRENPNHVLAHKELAVVLRQLGDVKGSLAHRREVKRLVPSDILNRVNMSVLFEVLGANNDALQEIEELLEMDPNNRQFQMLKAHLANNPCILSYPQHYDQEANLALGDKCNLGLIDSSVEKGPYVNLVRLTYQWDAVLSYEEAFRLNVRIRAYIACAIYDAAIYAGLFCQASKISHGKRPSWLVEGEKVPISLTNSIFEFSDCICVVEIGPSLSKIGTHQSSGTHWAKLLEGFKNRFSNISV